MEKRDLAFEIRFFERLVKEHPDFVEALGPLAEAYTRAGRYTEGLRADQRLARLRKRDPVVHYNLACSYALTGDKDKALGALAKALALGFEHRSLLARDPDLKSLRRDPRFKKLASRWLVR